MAYGTLVVNVTANTAPLTKSVNLAAKQAGGTLSSALGGAAKGAAVGLAIVGGAAAAFGVSAFLAAGRAQEMTTALHAMANANKISTTSVDQAVKSVRGMGITYSDAQQAVAAFVQANLDVSQASKLARVAQDFAVVSNQNSSDTLSLLVQGIQEQNSTLLKSAGSTVLAGTAMSNYAKSLGLTVAQLTPTQREQAVLNAVMADGQHVAGAYAAAMQDPYKVLGSMPRVIDNIKVGIGQGLVQAIGPSVIAFFHLSDSFSNMIGEGGKLQPVFKALADLLKPLNDWIVRVLGNTQKWLENLKPDQIKRFVDQVHRFAPEIRKLAVAFGILAAGGLATFAKDIPGLGQVLGPLGSVVERFGGKLGLLVSPLGLVAGGFAALLFASPQLRDAVGKLGGVLVKDLADTFNQVKDAVKPLAPAFKIMGDQLGGVFATAVKNLTPMLGQLVTDAGQLVVSLVKSLKPELPKISKAMKPFVKAVSDLAGAVGQALIDGLKFLASHTSEWADAITTIMTGTVLPAFVDALKVLTGLVRVLGPYLPQIAYGFGLFLILKKVNPLIKGFSKAIDLVNGGLGIMDALLAANPFTVFLDAALVAVGIFTYFYTTNERFRKSLQHFGDEAKKTFSASSWISFGKAIGGFFVGIGRFFERGGTLDTWWSTHVDSFFIDLGKSAIGGLKQGFSIAMQKIGDWLQRWIFQPIWWAFVGWWQTGSPSRRMIGFGRDLIAGLLGGLWAGIRGVGTWILNNIIIPIWNSIKTLASWFWSAGSSAIGSLLSAMWNAIRGVGIWIFVHVISPVWGAISRLPGLVKTIGHSVIDGLWGGILDKMKYAWTWVRNNIVYPIRDAVIHWFRSKSPSQLMFDIGRNVILGFLGGIASEAGNIGGFVADVFGGWPQALGAFVGKGLISVGSLSTGALRILGQVYSTATGWLGSLLSGFAGVAGLAGGIRAPAGPPVGRWAPLVFQVLQMFGRPDLLGTILAQMATESGGDPNAINLWDINALLGHPSKGLMQVIQPTFDAYAGPFRSRGIWDPLANIYAAVAYALARYGRRIKAVLGHGHGYALGGIVSEPVYGFGARTGQAYQFAERGPELVSPLTGSWAEAVASGRPFTGGQTVINVYPQRGQSETEIAAAVSRRLAWAAASGAS